VKSSDMGVTCQPLHIRGLFLSFVVAFAVIENRAAAVGRFERRLISLIFAGRNRIILIRRELL